MDTAAPPLAPRPHILPSHTLRVPTSVGTAFVTVARDTDGQPFEVFLSVGKAGTETFAAAEALGRLMSLALRLDSPVPRAARLGEIATQLTHIGATPNGAGQPSLPDAVSRALLDSIGDPRPPAPASRDTAPLKPLKATARKPASIPDVRGVIEKKKDKRKKMDTSTVTLPPELLAATESLADSLLRAGPIAAYRRAKARLDADPHAHALLERFSAAQADLRFKQSRGTVTQADVDHLRALQREVQSNRAIMDYAETQQAAIAYLPEVNLEISQLLGVDFGSLAGPASC